MQLASSPADAAQFFQVLSVLRDVAVRVSSCLPALQTEPEAEGPSLSAEACAEDWTCLPKTPTGKATVSP